MSRISAIGQGLGASFNSMLQAIPDCPPGATELAKLLGVSRILAQRLLTAVRGRDPLATAHLIPGPEPLRRIVRSAARRGIDKRIIEDVERAINDFERLIKRVAGDRSSLDAIISAALPDARERFETEAKQNAYRGMRQIKGVAAEVSYLSFVMHPSAENEDRHDFVGITGFLGLRCIRPNVDLKLGVRAGVSNPLALPNTLSGTPITDPQDAFLHKYCSDSPVQLKLFENAQNVVYSLDWGRTVGLESTRDIVMAEMRLAAMRRHRIPDDPKPYTGFSDDIMVPTRNYIFDLVLHNDVYPHWQPDARVLETGLAGYADPNDPLRDIDEVDTQTRIEPLGNGIDRFRAEEIPNYMAILDDVCKARRWKHHEFRGYRVRIQYPVYSTQLQFRFDLRDKTP